MAEQILILSPQLLMCMATVHRIDVVHPRLITSLLERHTMSCSKLDCG